MNQPHTVPLHWVVALKPEAQAIIENQSLHHSASLSGAGFQVYENREQDQRLIVTGLGKVAAAAAVVWLAAQTGEPALWLNFGVCGHLERPVGDLVRAGRVTDTAIDKSWYPMAIGLWKGIDAVEVCTVDQPCTDYPEARKCVEMEAAGFISAALRFTSVEWVQVIKVVSDNKETDLVELNAAAISRVCVDRLPDLYDGLAEWRERADRSSERDAEPAGYAAVCERYHFTQTQMHQLLRVSRRILALEPSFDLEAWAAGGGYRAGKDILAALRSLADTKCAED